MALLTEYTSEEQNYFRIFYATTDILAEGLREIFKQEWDNHHKSTKREWKDNPRNGVDFYNGESPRNRKRYAPLLATMKNGDRREWNCLTLFYAILSSDCLRPGLGGTVRKNVDDLRNLRKEYAHFSKGSLSDIEFRAAIRKLHCAFQALGLPTAQIQDITNKPFPSTEQFHKIMKGFRLEVEDLEQEIQEKREQKQKTEELIKVLEDQALKKPASFCTLSPKPSHMARCRDRMVDEIAQQLRELKASNENRLSSLYISGCPGSGKSQLAGLVAERFYNEVQEKAGAVTFVMTLNATSPDSLLQSYVRFTRQLKCPEYLVTQTFGSKDKKVEDKITNLKMLIVSKLGLYSSWLLVVDNVISLSSIHAHLPQSENEAWAKGQLLITTQDVGSLPVKSSLFRHISIGRLEPNDARSFLAEISGIDDSELGQTVAKVLDCHPLTLANAAVYVKEIRQDQSSKHFGWAEYLKLFESSKLVTSKDTFASAKAVCPTSMILAITFAVEQLIRSDKFFKELFTLLSFCAPEPLNERTAINHITNMDEYVKKVDKEQIRMTFRNCSLLLYEDNSIHVHPIVHDVIKSVIGAFPRSQTPLVPSEIRARGQKAMLAYENALKTGKVKVYRARIMFIGQDRAGKTSLKNSFLGLPFDPEQQSTDGIELDVSKFEVDVDQVSNWKRTYEKQGVSKFVHKLVRMVAGKLEQEETNVDPAQDEKKEKTMGEVSVFK